MRYLKLPHCWIDEDKRVLSTTLRINPFAIEAYHPSIMDYTHPEDGNELSQDITSVFTRSGERLEILMTVKDFEKALSKFMAQ